MLITKIRGSGTCMCMGTSATIGRAAVSRVGLRNLATPYRSYSLGRRSLSKVRSTLAAQCSTLREASVPDQPGQPLVLSSAPVQRGPVAPRTGRWSALPLVPKCGRTSFPNSACSTMRSSQNGGPRVLRPGPLGRLGMLRRGGHRSPRHVSSLRTALSPLASNIRGAACRIRSGYRGCSTARSAR